LERFVGTAPKFQKLQLFKENGELYKELSDDDANLSSYSPQSGMVIYVKINFF
jgi:hypothetical protein